MSIALEVVALFVRKEKRDRLMTLSQKASRWSAFCEALLHDRRSLDPAVLVALPSHDLTVGRIVSQVGAPHDVAHCIGGAGPNDGRSAPLSTLITSEALHSRDVLIFDEKTKRAYYENHEGESFVLRR